MSLKIKLKKLKNNKEWVLNNQGPMLVKMVRHTSINKVVETGGGE